MEFKHAFHVFVDNFATTYKLLVYRLIIIAVCAGLGCAVVIPTLNNILGTAQYEQLSTKFSELWTQIISLDTAELKNSLRSVLDAIGEFEQLIISDKAWLVSVAGVCLAVVYLIYKFLVSVGDYVTGALVNDRMAMHAKSYFTVTLFKNIRQTLTYAAIYAPIAFAYDLLCVTLMWAIVFVGLGFVPAMIKIFLLAVLFMVFSAIKFTFTSDWLPSLIHAKSTHRNAIIYTFSRKGKNTGGVFSNALVIRLTVIALNVVATLFTFGAGLLLTMPATALIQICFWFVNYFDCSKLKYFVDEYTVIGPKKETPPTREQFFKGDE